MYCLEKSKIKHYDNIQKTGGKKEEKNAIQSTFTETRITYKICNDSINSKTPSKNKYLQEIPENTCFKVQDTESQIEFDRSLFLLLRLLLRFFYIYFYWWFVSC